MSTFSVHTYASDGAGSVNSFVVETANTLIAIDAQRQIHHAAQFLAQLEALNKPLVALFITHEHPDHIGGANACLAHGVEGMPVYAAADTMDAIRRDERGFIQLAAQIFKEDFSTPVPVPTREIRAGEDVEIDGVTIRAHELGAGESSSMSAFELVGSGALFCGDLVSNRMTPFLFEGRSRMWLDQLRAFPARFRQTEMLYCGHGKPAAGSELVPMQIDYLERFRARVAAVMKGEELTGDQKRAVRESVEAEYPGYLPVAEIPSFIEVSAAAVAAEISKGERA